MELNQKQESVVYNVTAEQDGWTVNASVVVVNGKVVNLDGSAFNNAAEGKSVALSGFRQGDNFVRTTHNVTDETSEVYTVFESLIAAVRDKYEV